MKRTILLSLLLALFMTKAIADDYTVVPGFDGPTWYDYKEEITNGSGSQTNPYLIEKAEHLAWIAYQVNVYEKTFQGEYFRIALEIDLEKIASSSIVQWVPIGTDDQTHEFQGTIDNPDKYVIKNMYMKVNSLETTEYFGLFGSLCGQLDGIILQDAEVSVENVTEKYYAGLLCGETDSKKDGNTKIEAKITNCTVQGYVTACGNAKQPSVGGLVGAKHMSAVGTSTELTSCVARTEMTINGKGGTISAGGVTGDLWETMTDCHAVVKMTASGLSTTSESYIGGVVGKSVVNFSSEQKIHFCTSSGDLTVTDDSKVYMGGVLGYNNKYGSMTISYCASAATLTGGHTVGGLVGYGTSSNHIGSNNDKLTVESSVYNGYIDGSRSTFVGGLFGYIEFGKDATTNILSTTSINYFYGTMKKPANSNYYGVIFGSTENLKDTKLFCRFEYDICACDLQTNGAGIDLDWQTISIYTPRPKDGDYSDYLLAILRPTTDLEGHTLCFTDNYKLCDIPFHVTNDWKTYYRITDVTTDFTIEDYKNESTGETVAKFTVPSDPNLTKSVRIDDKHVYPVDPGELVVSVKWNGLERKVHLDITYGKEWTGGRNETPDDGDGTADNPYVIHNADQLYSFVNLKTYNSEKNKGVYLKLANDIFFNTHLLQENGTPRADVINRWTVNDFYANLDGNGKTIYGLYVDATTTEADKSYGLFANLYGSVSNLAIVDSYVQVNAENTDINVGLLCGKMMEGSSVSNCLLHGTVSSNATRGGLCGVVEEGTSSITDLFVCAYVTWPRFPAKVGTAYDAAGVAYNSPPSDIMKHCFSISRVDEYNYTEGITDTDYIIDCYYDAQMLQHPSVVREFGLTTQKILSQQLFAGKDKWVQEEERYPMLKTFADSPYGKLLATPVIFDCSNVDDYYSADWAGKVNNIFEFPTEDVTWSALHGQTYLDVINDCGAASIVSETGDGVEILIAQSNDETSQCTRAMRTLPLNIRSGLTTFKFKDPVAKAAAEAAFDKNGDKILTLRELVEASQNDFAVFNASAKENEDDLIAFPEFRYFTETTTLSEGMLSGLDKLSELQLPKKLTTIDGNAFSGCASLEEITLPVTFTTVNMGALYGSGIKNILVNPKHKTMQSIDGALYETDNIGKLHLVVYPQGRGEADATISAPLHYIDDYAFYKIPSLRNIYIDNCLPEGNMVAPDVTEKPIVHESDGGMMDIYINDGSYGSSLFKEYKNDPYWGEYDDASHLHIYYPLTITNALWATLYIGFDTSLPEGLTAYVVTKDINTAIEEGEDVVTLKRIQNVIPATTPVVINAEVAGLYPLLLHTGSVPDIAMYNNKLIGSYIGQSENGKPQWGVPVYQEDSQTGGVLTLGRNTDSTEREVGFFKYVGKEVPPYRAYLTYTNTLDNSPARFFFVFDDTPMGITTGVENGLRDSVEGQREGWYTLDGQKLNGKPSKKGVYIYNGRAVVR